MTITALCSRQKYVEHLYGIAFITALLYSVTSGEKLLRVLLNKVYFLSSVSAGYVKHDIISVGNVMVEVNPVVCFSGVKLMDHSSL